jgi:hypothetical protein
MLAKAMSSTNEALTRQMLEWIDARPRERDEVMATWRSSCPRLTIWEDAYIGGLIDHEVGTGNVILSSAGKQWLLALAKPE